MNELISTLSADEAVLWQQYLAAEASGYRKRILATLAGFVQALQNGPEEQRHNFAETFCRQVADAGGKLPLREPLFAGVIGPYLVAAYARGEENAGRWLAHFDLSFWNMPPSQKLIDLTYSQSPIALLSEAFRRDPHNVHTQDLLIQKLSDQFAYAVHEVPAGILNGNTGSTVAECQEWQDHLALFREVVQKRGVAEKYAKAMRYWNFHFRGYADYLTHREQYENYADYINRHWQV